MAKRIPAKPVRQVEERGTGDATSPDWDSGVSTTDADGTDAPAAPRRDVHAADVGDVAQRPDRVVIPLKAEDLPPGGSTWDYIIVIEGVGDTDTAKDAGRRTAQALFDIGHTVKVAHITSRARGVEQIRIEGRA